MESTALINALLFGSMFLVLYFFFLKPKLKEAKEEEEFRAHIEKGAKVVTLGGIHGKILSLKEHTIQLEISPGTAIKIDRTAISVTLTKQAQNPKPETESK